MAEAFKSAYSKVHYARWASTNSLSNGDRPELVRSIHSKKAFVRIVQLKYTLLHINGKFWSKEKFLHYTQICQWYFPIALKGYAFEFLLFFLQYFHFYGDSLVIIVRIVFAVRKHCNTITICNGNYAMHFSVRAKKKSGFKKQQKYPTATPVDELNFSRAEEAEESIMCAFTGNDEAPVQKSTS